MRITRALWQRRQPMIKFIGKRHTPPAQVDHTPHAHPASPTHSLPNSFAEYRQTAQQHGPLGGQQSQSTSTSSASAASSGAAGKAKQQPRQNTIGGRSGRELGSVAPKDGEVWDRSELPKRFARLTWSEAEIEAVESGGASMIG